MKAGMQLQILSLLLRTVENFRPNQFFYIYGWSTSLSDDGSILAVGAPRSDKSDGDDFNGTDSGEVKIFTNSGYTNTEAANIDFSAQYGQYCGEDLDVSGDGQKVIHTLSKLDRLSYFFGKVMTYEIEINDIDNGVPYFTSDSVFTADENGTAIGTVTAADSDGDTLSFYHKF